MKASLIHQLALGLTLLVGSAVLSSCGEEPVPAQQMGPMPITVALPLRHQVVEWDHYLGRIEAVETVEVRARVSGHLEALHFTEGGLVKKGDPIASIDDKPFKADLARSAAELTRVQSELVVAQAQKKQAEASLAEVEARQRQFKSLFELAEKRLKRATKAVAGNAISEETVDVRESEVQQAKANLEAAEAEVVSAKAGITTAEATIKSVEARIAAAQANHDRAELDLSYCKLEAPISGRISRENVNVGNFIVGGGQGGTLITTIVTSDPVYCYFDPNEQALLRYLRLDRSGNRPSSRNVKNPIYLKLVDETGYPHKGYIDFVDNRVDRATGTIRARAILRNESGLLTPGMFATIYVPGSSPHVVTLVLDSCIVSDQSDRFVWVIEADGSVGRRNVELGPVVMGRRVIRSGLKGDEKIVIKGLQRIRPGVPVAPTLEAIELAPSAQELPNDFSPVPESEWIPHPSAGANTGEKNR